MDDILTQTDEELIGYAVLRLANENDCRANGLFKLALINW